MILISPSRLVVFAGPSGVGKGTVVAELRKQHPEVWVSVSVTTRDKRPGEVNGVHYWFITVDQFEQMRADGELLEWAQVHGKNYYGTPRGPVAQHLAAGQPTLLEIDLAGARQVKETMPDALFVFLAPPSYEELVRRLVGRGTETEAERTRRLETAKTELAAAPEFDHVITNNTVPEAAADLAHLMGVPATE